MLKKFKNLNIGQMIIIITLFIVAIAFTTTNSIAISGGHLSNIQKMGLFTSISLDGVAIAILGLTIYLVMFNNELKMVHTILMIAGLVFALVSGIIPLKDQHDAYANYRSSAYINDYVAVHMKESVEAKVHGVLLKFATVTRITPADLADSTKVDAGINSFGAALKTLVNNDQLPQAKAEEIVALFKLHLALEGFSKTPQAVDGVFPNYEVGHSFLVETFKSKTASEEATKMVDQIFKNGFDVYKTTAPMTVNLWPATLAFTIIGGAGLISGSTLAYIKR